MPKTDNKDHILKLRIDLKTLEILDKICSENGVTRSDCVRGMISKKTIANSQKEGKSSVVYRGYVTAQTWDRLLEKLEKICFGRKIKITAEPLENGVVGYTVPDLELWDNAYKNEPFCRED